MYKTCKFQELSKNFGLKIEICPACTCGCELRSRIEITRYGEKLTVDHPAIADVVIAALQEGRQELWGEIFYGTDIDTS